MPYNLEPKELQELNLCDAELFESLWVKLKRPQVASHVNKVFLMFRTALKNPFLAFFLEIYLKVLK